MTGPDGNYRPPTARGQRDEAQWGSGQPGGPYPTGTPYPEPGPYSAGAPYPAAGQYPSGPNPAQYGTAQNPGPNPPAPAPAQSYPSAQSYPLGQGYPSAQSYPGGQDYPSAQSYPPGQGYPSAEYPSGQAYPSDQSYGSGQRYPSAPSYPSGQGYPPAQASPQGWEPLNPPPYSGSAGGQAGFGPEGAGQSTGSAGRLERVRPSTGFGAAKLLGLAVAVLGGVNFVCGFLPEVSAPRTGDTLSVFAVGPAYVPILLLIAGLLALAAFLPGSERSRLAVAAVSVGGAVGAIVSLGTPGSFELFANPNQVSSGLGAILLVVFGIVQAVVAVGAYVVGADAPWTRGKNPARAGRPADQAGQSAWDPTSVGGSGPIDPRLVGQYAPQGQTAEARYQGQTGRGWSDAPAPGQPNWSPGAPSAGHPQKVAGYGAAAQRGTTATPGMGSASPATPSVPRPGYREEPATGPQVVVGMETVRVDVRKPAHTGLSASDESDPSRNAPAEQSEDQVSTDAPAARAPEAGAGGPAR